MGLTKEDLLEMKRLLEGTITARKLATSDNIRKIVREELDYQTADINEAFNSVQEQLNDLSNQADGLEKTVLAQKADIVAVDHRLAAEFSLLRRDVDKLYQELTARADDNFADSDVISKEFVKLSKRVVKLEKQLVT
jgi:hypothetical protein